MERIFPRRKKNIEKESNNKKKKQFKGISPLKMDVSKTLYENENIIT